MAVIATPVSLSKAPLVGILPICKLLRKRRGTVEGKMRARIRMRTHIPVNQLTVVLELLGWLPSQPQDHPLVIGHKERILSSLPDDRRDQVRTGFLLTIYRARTDSWGIVSREQPDVLAYRLDQSETALVHKTAEDLIESLQKDFPRQWPAGGHRFELVGALEILGRDTESPFHEGYVARGRVRRALSERRYELAVGLMLGVLATWCLYSSIPPVGINVLTPDHQALRAELEIRGRLGTAFAASATSAILYVVFTLIDVARHRHVVWGLPKKK